MRWVVTAIYAMVVFCGAWRCGWFVARAAAAEEDAAARQERAAKENAYKNQQKDLQEDIDKERKKKDLLEGQYGNVQRSLGATQRTIADVEADLDDTNREIDRRNAQIVSLSDQEALYRLSLSQALREAYFARDDGLIADIASNAPSRRFLARQDDLSDVQSCIIRYVQHVESAREAQQHQKHEVERLRDEKEGLLEEHERKAASLATQAAAVKTEIVKTETSLQELQAKLSAVESKLSSLLGRAYSTNDIVEAAKFASKKTGVRKDFILGVLVVETDLGRLTGGCTYKESGMSPARQKAFKDICGKLGYDYKKRKVSCPPKKYKGTGGAMGVAQFMPDTWRGYESQIAAATGHNPPDPWSLTDGVMAMALKLANDGATKKSGEWRAAGRYLGTCSTKNTRFYCEKVLYWADNYEKRL